jgi:hypothetical protein
MTSVFAVSNTPAHKTEKQKGGRYVGPVEKIPNMKNSFIRHIFNVKRQRDTLHGNKKFAKLLMKLTNIPQDEATHISIRDICSNKFLSYVYSLSSNVPTAKIYHYGEFSKCENIPKNCVIKYDKGQDGIHVLCLRNGSNLYNEERELAWKSKADVSGDIPVMIEELLENKYFTNEYYGPDRKTPHGLIDYKMFVFNGTSEFISIILRDDEREIIKSFWYDLRNDIALTDNFNYDIFPLKRDLDLMKHYCKMLNFTKSFFVRIDFYITNEGVLFGEFTLRPGNFYKGWRIPKVNKNILELFSERMEHNGIPAPPPPTY